MNTQKLYFTKHASICMLTNNLIKITFISDGEIDLSEAKEMHSIALKLSKDMPYAVLIISSKHHNLVTKSARSYLATIESRLAEAIVVDNLPNRMYPPDQPHLAYLQNPADLRAQKDTQ